MEASTRRGYQAAWRIVLTWEIAHQALGQLMPMSKVILKALTQELLTFVDELAAVLTSALGQRAWRRLLVAGTKLRGALFSRGELLIAPWDSPCQ